MQNYKLINDKKHWTMRRVKQLYVLRTFINVSPDDWDVWAEWTTKILKNVYQMTKSLEVFLQDKANDDCRFLLKHINNRIYSISHNDLTVREFKNELRRLSHLISKFNDKRIYEYINNLCCQDRTRIQWQIDKELAGDRACQYWDMRFRRKTLNNDEIDALIEKDMDHLLFRTHDAPPLEF